MKKATVIRHLPFEGLGSFRKVLETRGYTIDYLEAGRDELGDIDPLGDELVIILGGPIGVNQQTDYPFIQDEIVIARDRIAADRPTLGICLGAQVMAHALGATINAAGEPEIGWSTLELTAHGKTSPLKHLEDVPVLHWHGDQLELPKETQRLASTPACPNQAFRLSSNVLGLQCHPEVCWPELETWLIGNTRSLVANGLSVPALREACRHHAPGLEAAGAKMLHHWLDELEPA